MRWQDGAGTYGSFISLGSTCQTAYQLRRLQLRKFAGPLDWFISRSVPDVARLIRNRFGGFMDLERLELAGREPDKYVVRDNEYAIVSYHDFPLFPRWTDGYPDFKMKIDRRVHAFLTAVKKGPVCFVRSDTSKTEAQQLYRALRAIVPGRFRLLIVNNGLEREVRDEEWGLPHVASVSIPRGADWRGFDPAWDQIMKEFKLKSGS
ncbi:DUF1796 family putative cysteine peptidase [Cohnella nanjingensis]|uniref:Peptidase n=1 Tax=Cohnella nanjingensis TaxID=1387779 RepID=A0A7X0RU76_9BACL|nr:DUF1796 family putative cysteine peptidase [Cohnella nanjingensis]MBB6673754.1 hypothetical protein [Cohnella nanjingensis]